MTEKESMGAYLSVFNQHLNDAAELTRADFIEIFGQEDWDREMQPFVDKGVMSLFQEEPNPYTKFYVKTVTKYVNEGES